MNKLFYLSAVLSFFSCHFADCKPSSGEELDVDTSLAFEKVAKPSPLNASAPFQNQRAASAYSTLSVSRDGNVSFAPKQGRARKFLSWVSRLFSRKPKEKGPIKIIDVAKKGEAFNHSEDQDLFRTYVPAETDPVSNAGWNRVKYENNSLDEKPLSVFPSKAKKELSQSLIHGLTSAGLFALALGANPQLRRYFPKMGPRFINAPISWTSLALSIVFFHQFQKEFRSYLDDRSIEPKPSEEVITI